MATPLPVHLVDVSHWQDPNRVDWDAARAAGVRGVMVKATEGGTVKDEAYDAWCAAADEAGWRRGAYAFAWPEPGDALAEARWFLRHARPKPGDLRPWLDLEINPTNMSLAELGTWARRWLDVVEDAIGSRPLVYTPYDLGDLGTLVVRPRYNDDNRPPALPHQIHQFSDGQHGTPKRVAGFPFPTDLNTIRPGTRFRQLLIPDPAAPPVATGLRRFVTANVRKGMTPAQTRGHVRNVAEQAGVVGWQEMYEPSDHEALRALGDGWRHHIPDKGGAPISVRRSVWKLVSSQEIPLHPATPGICKERRVVLLILEHRETGARLCVSNGHTVPIRAHKLRLRLKMEREGKGRWRSAVASFVSEGIPAVILGDLNRKGSVLKVLGATTIAGQPVTDHVPADSLDHVLTVPGRDGKWELQVASADTLDRGNSDHRPRRAFVRLVETEPADA